MNRTVLALVSILAVLAPAPGLLGSLRGQSLPAGPIPVGEQNPLYRLQYVPEAEPVDVVERGELVVGLVTAYSNVFEQSASTRHAHLFDLEQMTNTLGVRYGIAEGWETGAELSLHTGWGGFLDGFVSGFHNTLGLPNGGRETEPEGQHEVRLVGVDPDISLDLDQRTLDLEGVSVFTRWQPIGAGGGPYAVSLRGTVRSSTGPLDAGRIDTALSVSGRVSGRGDFEGTHLYGSATFVALDPVPALEPLFAGTASYYMLGFERGLTSGLAGILQLSAGTPWVDAWDESRLSRFPSTLTFGLAGRGEGEWDWEFGFVEDFPPESPTVDFTVTLGIDRRISF